MMLLSALAFLLSLLLTFILGGLIGVLIRLLLAFLFLPLIMMFRPKKQDGSPSVISSGPWILTIEFFTMLFYGWFANYIGVWVFGALGAPIDWSFTIFVLFGFVWSDLSSIQRNKLQLEQMANNSGLRPRLPFGVINEEMQELRLDNYKKEYLNLKYTALFGKIAGVVIGGFNLIFLKG